MRNSPNQRKAVGNQIHILLKVKIRQISPSFAPRISRHYISIIRLHRQGIHTRGVQWPNDAVRHVVRIDEIGVSPQILPRFHDGHRRAKSALLLDPEKIVAAIHVHGEIIMIQDEIIAPITERNGLVVPVYPAQRQYDASFAIELVDIAGNFSFPVFRERLDELRPNGVMQMLFAGSRRKIQLIATCPNEGFPVQLNDTTAVRWARNILVIISNKYAGILVIKLERRMD